MNQKPVALVTGGNRGMGLASCKALAEKGFHVLLASRNRQCGNSAAKELAEQGIDTAVWLATSADSSLSGGFYRDRELIDW